MRPRRAIGEALAVPLPADPLRGGLTRATDQHSRRGDRQPGGNKRNEPLPLAAAESSISMKNHRALLVVATPTSRTLGGLFDVTASADRQQRVWDLQLDPKRTRPISLGRIRWAGHYGHLVLAPPLVFGGEVGDRLVFHWEKGGVEHTVSLHSWAPLPEAVATLKAVVDSAT